jgi:ribosomal protein S18 acetylase RimI-like enzyme
MVRGLAVAPEFQRRGLGRMLVDRAIEVATTRGARRMTLRVLGTNGGARRLYEACGFEVEGVLRGEFFLDGSDVDDHFMSRALPS